MRPTPLKPCKPAPGILAWSAWQRALAVLPALALLWLAVVWANIGAVPL